MGLKIIYKEEISRCLRKGFAGNFCKLKIERNLPVIKYNILTKVRTFTLLNQ